MQQTVSAQPPVSSKSSGCEETKFLALSWIFSMLNDVSSEKNPNVSQILSYAFIRFSSSANRLLIMTRYASFERFPWAEVCLVRGFFVRHSLNFACGLNAAQPCIRWVNLFGRHLPIHVKSVPCKLNCVDQWCHQASCRIQADCMILEWRLTV